MYSILDYHDCNLEQCWCVGVVVVVVVGLVSGWTVRTQLQDAPEGRATGEAPPNLDAGTTMH